MPEKPETEAFSLIRTFYNSRYVGHDERFVVADLDDAQLKIVREHMELMEGYIGKYSQMEHDGDLDGMTDTLIRITERVAEVRRLYQPDFPLPTFAEIRRVVQVVWDEDMGKIDPREDNPTAGEIEEETESADDAAGEGDQA